MVSPHALPASACPAAQPAALALPARPPRPPTGKRPWRLIQRSLHSPWPAPALLAWLLAWAAQRGLAALGLAPALAWAAAAALAAGLACALPKATVLRRCIVALGFVLSGVVGGQASSLPAWAWLLPLLALLAAYPLRAWRDAPVYPTPVGALAGLAVLAPLPPGASVLDAGCGLGHGLAALRSEYAGARLHGVEWSGLLRLATTARCPWATVRRGDMWAADWSAHAMVYLFQRPESMARALAKAQAEMAPGSWLASLEFAVAGVAPSAVLQAVAGKPVWLYRMGPPATTGSPLATQAQPASPAADNTVNKPAQPGRR